MRARIVASAVLATALLLGTTGCTFFANQATLTPYDPSDGIGATIGTVEVRNALLLTKDGQEASLVATFINDGAEAVSLTVRYDTLQGSHSDTLDLKAGESQTLGAQDSGKYVIQGIDTRAGALFPMFLQYGSLTGTQLLVPVLDGTQAEYSKLLPSPSPSEIPASPAASPKK